MGPVNVRAWACARQRLQLFCYLLQGLDGSICLVFCVHAREAHPDSPRLLRAHGGVHKRGAVGACPHADAIAAVQHSCQLGCADAFQVECRDAALSANSCRDGAVFSACANARTRARTRTTKDRDAGYALDARAEALVEAVNVAVDIIQATLLYVAQPLQKAGYTVGVDRAGFQVLGIVRRLGVQGTLHAGTTSKHRLYLHPRAQHQPACAHGTHQALMAGEAEDISVEAVQRDRQMSCCLGGIHNHKCPALMGNAAHASNVVDIPGEIGGMGQHHKMRVRPEGPGIGVQVNAAIRQDRHNVQVHAALGLAQVKRAQHRVV